MRKRVLPPTAGQGSKKQPPATPAQLARRDPTAGDLEAFASAFPADSASYLVHGAMAALRSGTQALEAAATRFEGLLLSSPEAEASSGRLLTALTLHKVLDDHLRPAQALLDELDNPGALPPALGWAVGPWHALDSAAREMDNLSERLRAAYKSMAKDELGSAAGAGLALALSGAIEELQAVSREVERACDRLEPRVLADLPRSKRLALRLAGMARLAEGWQEELRGVAALLDLERTEAGLASDVPLSNWLHQQIDGPVAEVAATLSRLATSVPPDTEPRPDQVS